MPEEAATNWPLQDLQIPGPGPDAPWWPHGAQCHQNLGRTLGCHLEGAPASGLQFLPVLILTPWPLPRLQQDPQPGLRGPPSNEKGQPTSTWHFAQNTHSATYGRVVSATRSGPGSAHGQAHVHVSCPHFPHWQSGDTVLLPHVATQLCLCCSATKAIPPWHPVLPALEGLTSLCCSLTTLDRGEVSPEASSQARPGFRFQNLQSKGSLVTSSQLDRGELLS